MTLGILFDAVVGWTLGLRAAVVSNIDGFVYVSAYSWVSVSIIQRLGIALR
jgi:hypothetical protein